MAYAPLYFEIPTPETLGAIKNLPWFGLDQTTGLPTFTTDPAWLNAHGENVSLADLPTVADTLTGKYVCPAGSTPAVDKFTGHVYCVIADGPTSVPISSAAMQQGQPFLINAAITDPANLASAIKDNPPRPAVTPATTSPIPGASPSPSLAAGAPVPADSWWTQSTNLFGITIPNWGLLAAGGLGLFFLFGGSGKGRRR